MTGFERCQLCGLEADCCLCTPSPDVEAARVSRLNAAELETLESADQRLEVLGRGRGGVK